MSQQGSLDASGLIEKQKAEQAAAALAKQKEQEEQQKKQIQADYEKYAAQQKALQEKIKSVPQESYQSGVEVRKDTIGKAVYSGGASKGRLVFEDQIFPVYSTRYTEEGKKQLSEYQAELEQLEAQHQQRLQADSYYKSVTEAGTTSANVESAQKRIQELQKKKAYIESFPTPTPQGKHVSGTQRAKIQELREKREHEINEIEREVRHLETFVNTPGTVIPGFQATAFQPTVYSSPSKSVGYNPATGQVEIGASDGRSVVVSTSKTEDIARAKAAGYTGSATVDPRVSDIFRPVDAGILTPGIKAQPGRDITTEFRGAEPARTRPKAQTGQPDSIYANPLYLPKEQQKPRPDMIQSERKARPKAQTGVLDNLFGAPEFVTSTEREAQLREQQKTQIQEQGLDILGGIKTATPKVKPREFTISLSEGPVTAPPEYTQEQIDQMTEAQYNQYRKDIEAYNKYVERYNAEQQTLTRQANLQIKQQNLLSYQQSKKEIIAFIEDAKKQGYKTIVINTPTGAREVSVNRAYKEIISSKDVIGIGVIPNIPEGYTVAGPIATPILVQIEPPKIEKKKPLPGDAMGQFLYDIEQAKFKDPILQGTRGFFLSAGGNLASLSNLAGEYITKPLYEATTGKPLLLQPKTYEPAPTATGVFLGGVGGAAYMSIIKRDPKLLPKALAETLNMTEAKIQEQGITGTAGDIAGALFPLNPVSAARKAAAAIPFRTDVIPFAAKEGLLGYRSFAVGYDTKNIELGGKVLGGKYFVGKADPAAVGIEKIQGATGGAFNVYELSSYKPFQLSRMEPIIKYAEKKGLAPAGSFEMKMQEAGEIARQRGLKFKYESKVPSDFLSELSPGIKSDEMVANIAKTQKDYLDPIKGSATVKLRKDAMSRPIGDIDVEAPTLEGAGKAADILVKTPVKPGFALEKEGYNISIGQSDPTKAFFDIKLKKGELGHGTDLPSAKKIMREGPDPEQRPYGMPAFFATENAEIFANFASGGNKPVVVIGEVEKAATLFYKKIPKKDRKTIIDKSFKIEAQTGKPQWEAYQELLARYASDRGFKAVTKPYKALSPNATKFETIVLKKGVFEPKLIEYPTRFGIKEGTGKKVINIVTEGEQVKQPEGLGLGEKIYGKDWPNDITKLKVEGTKDKLKAFGAKQQITAKFKSASSFITKETLEEAQNLTPEQRKAILGDYLFTFGPKGHRYTKDLIDPFMQTRDAARLQFLAGDRAGALASGKTMRMMIEYYKGIDWGKEIRNFKPSLEVTPKSPEPVSKSIGTYGTIPKTVPQIASARPIPPQEESSLYRDQSVRSLTARASARGLSIKSTSASRGVSGSMYSPKKIESLASMYSPKSPSIKSPFSTASPKPSGFSPSVKPKSPFSPISPKTKSPASPINTSPLSPLTGSPLRTSPISPLQVPMKTLNIKALYPRTVKPRLFVPFDGKKYKKRKKEELKPNAFIGNVRQEDILGMYKDFTTKIGIKKSARQARRDITLTRKERPRFKITSTKTSKIISRRSNPILVKNEKKRKAFVF